MAEKAAIDLHRVTAILVVHDGAVWLPEVVASITSQTRSVDQIIAIDTGSLDASSKLLKGAKIPTLAAPRDLGFGSAIQNAVEKLPACVSGSHEWLWILHDDFAPMPNALEKFFLNEHSARGSLFRCLRGFLLFFVVVSHMTPNLGEKMGGGKHRSANLLKL